MGKLRLSEVAWPLGRRAGFGSVARLSAWTARPLGASARGGLLWGAPGEPGRGAGCPYPRPGPGREQCGLYPPSWPARRPPATWRPGPRRLSTGRAGAWTSPAPRVLPGPATEWPDAAAASALSRWAGPWWWVWGSGPPASATSATLPAPTSIFQKFPVGGAEPQRPPLAPPPQQLVPDESRRQK